MTGRHIIDGHVHVASDHFIPQAFIEASMDNLLVGLQAGGAKINRKRLMDMVLPKVQDHLADGFVAAMDEAGVAQAVLLCPDFTFALKEPGLTIEEMIAEHHQILQRHEGRLILFAGVDPGWGQDGYDLFERSIDQYDVRGLKLYPPCGYSPSDPSLDPLYEICAAKGMPVLLHTGPSAPCLSFIQAHPNLIDEAARRFPQVRFILAHGGVNHVSDAVRMVAYRPNVYLDISGYAGVIHPESVRDHLCELFNLGVNHKIIFGTDYPLFNMRATYADLFEPLLGEEGALEEASAKEGEMILHGNIERLLN